MNFVGRERELSVLAATIEKALQGRTEVALIAGITGSGKSSLMGQSLGRAAASHPEIRIAKEACYPGVTEPLAPFRRLAARLIEEESSGLSRRMRRAGTAMARAAIAVGPEFVALLFPPAGVVGAVGRHLLGEVGIEIGHRRDVQNSGPDASSDFVAFFDAVTSSGLTLALGIDDLHWADPASLSLLGRLAMRHSREGGGGLLILGTFRSHEVESDAEHPLRPILLEIKRNRGDVLVDLNRISDGDRRRFVDQVVDCLGPNHLDDGFRMQLFNKTKGNPLHVTELLQGFEEAEEISPDAAGVLVARRDLDWARVPPMVEGAIESRMDRLSPDGATLLETAAVEGVAFSAQVLARASGRELPDIVRILTDDLDRRHSFVEDLGPSQTEPRLFEFRFRHPEYQRHGYERLRPTERAMLHERVAKALLEIHAQNVEEIAIDVASHFEYAGQGHLASNYLEIAAEKARLEGFLSETKRLAFMGLERVPLTEPRLIARLELLAGTALEQLGEYRDSVPHLNRALEMATDLGDDTISGYAHFWLGAAAWRLDDDDRARHHLDLAFSFAEKTGDRSLQGQVLLNRGILARRDGDVHRALRLYRKAEVIAREAGHNRAVSAALNNMAFAYSRSLGDFDSAVDVYEAAIQFAASTQNPKGQAVYLTNISYAYSRLGRIDQACQAAERGIAISREIGVRRQEALSWNALGSGLLRARRLTEAMNAFEEALSLLAAIETRGTGTIDALCGWTIAALLAEDSYPLAVERAEQAVEHGQVFVERGIVSTVAPTAVFAAALAVGGDSGRALSVLPPETQTISSGADPWWLRWQTAIHSCIRELLSRPAQSTSQASTKLRLALAACSAPGIVEDARQILELVVSSSGETRREPIDVLEHPFVRTPAARAARDDRARLDALAARLRATRQITRLAHFLSPLNRDEEKQRVIQASVVGERYEPQFRYRTVPSGYEEPLIELLGDIDPAASIWDELIYESVEDHRDLIVAARSRDPQALTEASKNAFGIPSRSLHRIAAEWLTTNPVVDAEAESVSATEAAASLSSALAQAGLVAWEVEIEENMPAAMSVNASQKRVRVRRTATFTPQAVRRLLIHEVGTHVFRSENGARQQLALMSLGVGSNTQTEEGLATLNEDLAELLDWPTKRRHALRALAVFAAETGSFSDVYSEIAQHTRHDEAFDITLRVKRGIADTRAAGVYFKDHSYLEGYLKVKSAVEDSPDNHRLLMSAKLPLRMLPILSELDELGLLAEPAFLPSLLS